MLHAAKRIHQALLSPFTLMHPAILLLLTLITFSGPALAAPIYQETLQGNGGTRLLIERSLNVSESGRYFLTLKNGDLGPRNIEQCESEDTVAAKREGRHRPCALQRLVASCKYSNFHLRHQRHRN